MAKVTYTDSEKQFINPYNFIEVDFDDKGSKSALKKESPETLTGVLKCKLITKTPIAIPDENIGTEEEKDYTFFTIDGQTPVIPGSSIRGVIRNVYETITGSCFVTSKDEFISHRTMGLKPGILKKEKNAWNLYEAKRYVFRVQDDGKYKPIYGENAKGLFSMSYENLIKDYELGEEVYFETNNAQYQKNVPKKDKNKNIIKDDNGKPELEIKRLPMYFVTDLKKEKQQGWEQGYMFIGEAPKQKVNGKIQPASNKHFESIFKMTQPKSSIQSFTEEELSIQLDKLYEIYNDKSVNHTLDLNPKYYPGYENAKKKGIIPIWYDASHPDRVSFAACGRIMYVKKMFGHLNEKKPCTERNSLCPACQLFGMVGKEAFGSSVRVSDATWIKKENESSYEQEHILLKELAAPHITYTPFYLKGKDYDANGVSLRGRKYYWHNTKENGYEEKNQTERNAKMQLVKKDNSFSFEIFYDAITKEQLNDLIWTITLGENEEKSNYCHKIGHGKPIGLGSVKIVVESDTRRSFSIEDGYSANIQKNIAGEKKDDNIINQLLTITDITKTEDVDVCYPYIVDYEKNRDNNDYASFHWFAEFKKDRDKKLPGIEQSIGSKLPAYEIKKELSVEKKGNKDNSNNKQYVKYKENGIYDAVVEDRANNNRYVNIKLKDGGFGSIPFKNSMKNGDNIKVIYKGMKPGKNGKMYHNWELKKE